MGRGSSKAGGTTQKATKARNIENMNEAQLNKEISKTQRTIDRANSTMNKNNISATSEAKAMREAFPLGVGGDGWSKERTKARNRGLEADANKAKRFTEAYSEKAAAETRLKALESAKKQVKGTDKTVSQIKTERTNKAVKDTQSTLKWKTTQKGGWANGGYKPKIIKAGNIEVHGSDGLYMIYENGKLLGRTDKLAKAKAYAERRSK